MKLDILSPEEEIFSGEVEAGSLPGISGRIQWFNPHVSIISSLGLGLITMTVKDQKEESHYEIKGGVVEMLNNTVVVLID